MKVSELVAKLQSLPQDMEVVVCHPAQCCCGECFLPLDEYEDSPDPQVGTPYGHGQDGTLQKVVL